MRPYGAGRLESRAIFRQLLQMVKVRCGWCGSDPLYVRYHDREWGIPLRERNALFELLMLEGMQAGLSWITVLKKRREFDRVFAGFVPERLARWSSRDVLRALGEPGIIRHRGKIEAAVANARAYLELDRDGSAADYLWSFVGGAPVQNRWRSLREIPAHTPTAQAMSKALKGKGFKFVGPTICYAFMQAAGLVNDHLVDCFRHERVARARRLKVL